MITELFPILSTPDLERALRFYPWGERVARVLDPDGNEIIIGQKLG